MATRTKTWGKQDMINYISDKTKLSKRDSERALNSFIEGVRTNLKKGTPVRLIPFGSFEVRKRSSRTGRNPRTGEPIKIKARNVPYFKPGKYLRSAV
ncbi:MAG: HU family DNA-binding protein [Armatimonadota bacterium]